MSAHNILQGLQIIQNVVPRHWKLFHCPSQEAIYLGDVAESIAVMLSSPLSFRCSIVSFQESASAFFASTSSCPLGLGGVGIDRVDNMIVNTKERDGSHHILLMNECPSV